MNISSRFESEQIVAANEPLAQRGTCAVVVPCHNYGRFLPEAIESLMLQSQLPEQLIIVDDASTDETAQMISQLKSRYPLIESISNPSRLGAIDTFRVGISATNTTYVMVLSADDRVSSGYLESSCGVLDDGYDVARTRALLFGERTGVMPIAPWGLNELLHNNQHHGSMMFRRSLYDRVGGYRSMEFEDWDLWLRMAGAGATAGTAVDCQLEYRQHGPSRNQKSVWKARRARLALRVRNPRLFGLRGFATLFFKDFGNGTSSS